jgi:hypothetical protein
MLNATKRRPGALPRGDGPAEHKVTVRLNEKEKAAIDAARGGQKEAVYLRDAALAAPQMAALLVALAEGRAFEPGDEALLRRAVALAPKGYSPP